MGKEMELPKNIRQIGDIQGKEKVFLEDYVMTYIRKKEKQEAEGYLGIFLGERQEQGGITYVFIRGILEVSSRKEGEKGNDGLWQKAVPEKRGEQAKEIKNAEETQEKEGKRRGGQTEEIKSTGEIQEKAGKRRGGHAEEIKSTGEIREKAGKRRDGHAEEIKSTGEIQEKAEERRGGHAEGIKGSEETQEKAEERRETQKEVDWGQQLENERREYFPGWSVQGCCVIGSYPSLRMQELFQRIPQAGGLLYHLQDQEESVYSVENERYHQVKGYFVFYEQNRKMQEYMADVFSHDNVEKEGCSDGAIKSFRKKVKEKGIQKNVSFLKMASSFFVITVLVIGVIVVNRVDKNWSVQGIATTKDTTEENEALQTTSGKTTDGTVFYVTDSMEYPEGMTEVSGGNLLSEYEADAEKDALAGSAAFWEENLLEDNNQVSAEQAGESRGSEAWAEGSTEQADESRGSEAWAEGSTKQADESGAWTEGSTEQADESRGSEAWADRNSAQEDAGQVSEAQDAAAMRQMQAAYVIKEGDTLAEICKRYYGNLERLTELCQINDIADANMILPGQKIVLP